jgi:tetratricopeptide (TPR) repeat protein
MMTIMTSNKLTTSADERDNAQETEWDWQLERPYKLFMGSPEDIEAVAALVPLPKTGFWHTALAWTLLRVGGQWSLEHHTLAIHHFNEALEEPEATWQTYEGLAICYHYLDRSPEAINYMQQAIARLPDTEEGTASKVRLHSEKSLWSRQLDDKDLMLSTTQAAFEESIKALDAMHKVDMRYVFSSIRLHLDILCELKRSSEAIGLILELDTRLSKDGTCSLLDNFLQMNCRTGAKADMFEQLSVLSNDLGADRASEMGRHIMENLELLAASELLNPGILSLLTQCVWWLYADDAEQQYAIEISARTIILIDRSDEATQQRAWVYGDQIARIVDAYLRDHPIKEAVVADQD